MIKRSKTTIIRVIVLITQGSAEFQVFNQFQFGIGISCKARGIGLIKKTNIMASGPITSWQIDGETVTDFIFLGSKITEDDDCSHEI